MMQQLNHRYPKMPWQAIDSVVFDVGNVLLRFDPMEIMRRVLPDEEALYPQLMEKVFGSPYWIMRDRGSICMEQAAEWMIGDDEPLRSPILHLMHGWEDLEYPIEEGVRALKKCRQMGKRIFILSNYAKESFRVVQAKFSFFDDVEGFIVSGREGVIKPDPAIYRRLMARYGLEAARTLFIDDSAANVEAALNLGLQAILFQPAGTLDAFFGQ